MSSSIPDYIAIPLALVSSKDWLSRAAIVMKPSICLPTLRCNKIKHTISIAPIHSPRKKTPHHGYLEDLRRK